MRKTGVLVTGGTGFIGSALARTCQIEGDFVRILGQANTRAEAENIDQLRSEGFEVIEGSVVDRNTIETALEGIDVVYHLAAAQHEAGKSDQHFYDVNVRGTRNMLDASVEASVSRFVHGSTIGVYAADQGIVREHSVTTPDNIYGVTKLEAEKVVMSYQDRLPVVTIRISETYGPGDRRLLKLFRGVQSNRYIHIGRSDNLHHPIYIDDLVDALRLAAVREEAIGEVFVVPGFEVVTTREMVATIANVLNVSTPKLTMPLKPIWVAAGLMEWALRPLGIKPPLHRRRMHFFIKSFDFSGDRVRDILEFEPRVSFEEGIRHTADWYMKTSLIPDGSQGARSRERSLTS